MHAPQRDDSLISLVFPTYNPGPRLEYTWRELRRFLDNAPGEWEILFVCDGCTDGTPQRLAELSWQDRDRIRLLTYEHNRGKGYAVALRPGSGAGWSAAVHRRRYGLQF